MAKKLCYTIQRKFTFSLTILINSWFFYESTTPYLHSFLNDIAF